MSTPSRVHFPFCEIEAVEYSGIWSWGLMSVIVDGDGSREYLATWSAGADFCRPTVEIRAWTGNWLQEIDERHFYSSMGANEGIW